MKKIFAILTSIITISFLSACSKGTPVPLPSPEKEEPEILYEEKVEDVTIKVFSPLPNSLVKSPLEITGEAKGLWYFEGSFPVKLVDSKGTVLAQGQAQAQDEWMTENFAPFTASL